MQKFDFTAPASGAAQVVNVAGRYMKYVTGNAGGNDTGLVVTPGGKPGSKILLYPGQAITLPNDGTAGPGAWSIANAIGQAVITGTVVVGNGRIDDNTLQGTVQVVDGGKARTLAKTAFAGSGGQVAVASVYGRVQLWNPANSGVRAIVEVLQLRANSVAQNYLVGFNNAVLGTTSGLGMSKLSGGPNGVCSLFVDTNASPGNVGIGGATLASASVQANSVLDMRILEQIVILPGNGLLCWSATSNADAMANMQWYEEPNV